VELCQTGEEDWPVKKPGMVAVPCLLLGWWQNEVIFDNILLTDSEEEAAEYRAKYWKPKFEKEQQLAKEKTEKDAEDRKAKEPKLSFKVQYSTV